MLDKLYYLASPYSHKSKKVMTRRFNEVNKAAYKLQELGFMVVEPIVTSRAKELAFKIKNDYKTWQTRDRFLISKCDGVIFTMMEGLSNSVGCADEFQYANGLGKDILFYDPEENTTLSKENMAFLQISYGLQPPHIQESLDFLRGLQTNV